MNVEGYASLGELLLDATIQWKSELALVELNRKREAARLTFLDFQKAGLRFARKLEALGVGPDDRVVVLMSNQSRWLVSAFGVFARGAVLVPLDYKLTPEEQAALVAHCRPAVVVVEEALHRRFTEPLAARAVIVSEAPDDAPVDRWEDQPDGEPTWAPRTRDDLATIVYSSGTGGRPKGCMLTHGAYLSQLDALLECFPMQPGDRYFSILPTNHAIDFMVGFVGPFVCGATVVHQRTLRPELLLWTMQDQGITHMSVVPLILEAFARNVRERLDALPAWQRAAVGAAIGLNESLTRTGPRHGLSARLLAPIHRAFGGRLRLMFCGGAPTDRATAEFFYRLGIPVVIGYGLTEACTVVTVNGLSPFRADSVGSPVRGVEVRVADPDEDGIGEVLVRGPTLMRGYLDDPELTAEALRDGWLHTGDRGWLDASHHLHLVGRSKNMIVTPGGKNVYPEDVEGSLADVPCEELCVFASSFLWPSGLEYGQLVAVVRADGDAWRERLAALNRRLADHKRLGGVLRWDEPFPRTASMKVKREQLGAAVRARYGADAVEPLS